MGKKWQETRCQLSRNNSCPISYGEHQKLFYRVTEWEQNLLDKIHNSKWQIIGVVTYPARLRSLSLASLALLRKQQMTSSASRGNPNMQETIGITTVSGDTETDMHIGFSNTISNTNVELLNIVLM